MRASGANILPRRTQRSPLITPAEPEPRRPLTSRCLAREGTLCLARMRSLFRREIHVEKITEKAAGSTLCRLGPSGKDDPDVAYILQDNGQ